MSDNSQPVRPAFSAQLGLVTMGVWKKSIVGDDGKPRTYYDVSIKRSYKKDDGTWGHTHTYGGRDLGEVIALSQAAQQFIIADSAAAADSQARAA